MIREYPCAHEVYSLVVQKGKYIKQTNKQKKPCKSKYYKEKNNSEDRNLIWGNEVTESYFEDGTFK